MTPQREELAAYQRGETTAMQAAEHLASIAAIDLDDPQAVELYERASRACAELVEYLSARL